MTSDRRTLIGSAAVLAACALLAACGGGTGDTPAEKPRLVLFGESHASRWCDYNADTLTRWDWINRGVGGENTPDGLKRLPDALALQPDLFVLWEGGNDATRWGDLNEGAYGAMLRMMATSGTPCLAITTPPILRSAHEGEAAARVATAQRRLCAIEGIPVFDIKPMLDASLMLTDLLHLNAAGYRMAAHRLGWT